jgi:hypothetical protein
MPSGWCTDGDETAWRVGRLCGYLIGLQEGCVCMYVVMSNDPEFFFWCHGFVHPQMAKKLSLLTT